MTTYTESQILDMVEYARESIRQHYRRQGDLEPVEFLEWELNISSILIGDAGTAVLRVPYRDHETFTITFRSIPI